MNDIEILNILRHLEKTSKKPLPDDMKELKKELEKKLASKTK